MEKKNKKQVKKTSEKDLKDLRKKNKKKKGKKKKKGFTLIELLAVIVILGLLMAIAIPSVTRYITQSRRKTVVTSIDGYVSSVMTEVNDRQYQFSDATKVYAVPIECVSLEKGGSNPFGNWMQANGAYWAYVLVQYDSQNYNYTYGFTFKDDAGYGMYPTSHANIDEGGSQIKTGYDLQQPKTGLAKDFVPIEKWTGFNVTTSTDLVVLEAGSEGEVGNGETTCTLCQKGDNYEQVEKDKENNTNNDTNKDDDTDNNENTNNNENVTASMYGDANLDSNLNVSDIMTIKSHINNKVLLTGVALKNADVNGDGNITEADIAIIEGMILGQCVSDSTSPITIYGDVNFDGKVTTDDITVLQDYIIADTTLTGQLFKNADVNSDGKINVSDIMAIKSFIQTNGDNSEVLSCNPL